MPAMHVDELDYQLPPELIATTPAQPRDDARLMVVHRDTGKVQHKRVRDLPGLGVFQQGDLMLVNRSRVLPAYYRGTRANTGGKVSGLYLGENQQGQWHTMIESRGKLQPGEKIDLGAGASLTLVASLEGGEWSASCHGDKDTLSLLSRIGSPPLPPYIRKARKHEHKQEFNELDPAHYNTVYAQEAGSVAAPTAGLHFTPQLLDALNKAGVRRAEVVLHVGMGTFAPIRCDVVDDHPIHKEHLSIPADTIRAIRETRQTQHAITAVGTTTVRAIESLPCPLPDDHDSDYTAETGLFIIPGNGFEFRYTDHLMTNFHLPRSTLLALVAALPGVGIDRLMDWYRQAIQQEYRFYSYGDAMLIL